MSEASESLRVQRAGPAERGAQASLFSRCFDKPTSVDALRWRYDANPHGTAVSLILTDEDDVAACSFAYTPRLAIARDSSGSVSEGYIGQQGDVMTDPDWQRKGLARRLVQECAKATGEAGFVFNWGFPNSQSVPIFLKLDWLPSGKIRPRRHILRSDAKSKKRRLSDSRLAAFKVGWDCRGCAKAKRALGKLPAGYTTRILEEFPESVGELSAAVERRFPFMLRREAEWLNWRFLQTPSKGHLVHGLFDAEENLAGYIVMQPPTTNGEGDHNGVGYLVDFLVPDPKLEAPMIGVALEALSELGTSVVESWSVDGSWWSRKLMAAGFLSAKPDNHLYVYHFPLVPEHPLSSYARDASTWYLTDGDRDDELMG